ncbi:MAG: isochorismatase family protein [Candidatus Rokubacteria bacterium]|nr:isochorismatase family protein [Candidatus Rokubacteria bacterium]
MVTLPARPEPVEFDPPRAALVIVDMQNAFVEKGGMFDLAGMDISGARSVAGTIRAILDTARPAGLKVIYLQIGYRPDLLDGGGPASPNWHKELALVLMRERPELAGKLLVHGTWDFAIVDELKPEPGDIVIPKSRYSGFAGTPLDSVLRTAGIRQLIFTGVATNVCVESTLRDAFFHEYWPILVSDATMQAGPPSQQAATLLNVETFFGWVTSSRDLIACLRQR